VSANISMNNSNTNYIANPIKRASVVNADRTYIKQKSKSFTQSNSKNISQMNEYDIETMPVSEKFVIEAIQKANKAISGGDRRFEFSIHEKTNEIVVKIFDSNTNELIREIPNEKILDMVANICEMAGLFVDERR